jgi:hypothetical protein
MTDRAHAVIDKLIEAIGGEVAVAALREAGVLVLMPVKVGNAPKGSTVHFTPPTVSLNWPEGAYRDFVTVLDRSDSRSIGTGCGSRHDRIVDRRPRDDDVDHCFEEAANSSPHTNNADFRIRRS